MSRLSSWEIIIAISVLLATLSPLGSLKDSYGHLVGDYAVNQVAEYKISFVPVPEVPIPQQNSRLLFGMQDAASREVFNVFATLKVESLTNAAIEPYTYPKKFYEFGDISVTYIFPEDGLYKVTLEAEVGEEASSEKINTGFEVAVGNYQRPFEFLTSLNPQAIVSYAAIAGGSTMLGVLYLRWRSEKKQRLKSRDAADDTGRTG